MNVNGVMSAQWDMNRHLKECELDIMGVMKLSIKPLNIGDRRYNVWKWNKEEKQGGGSVDDS